MMDPQSSPVFPIRSHGHDMDETGGSHILSSWGGFKSWGYPTVPGRLISWKSSYDLGS